tara:strand:+ start:62483 stop:62719 length:237 start_codon:yes stop_codon:yes gene_type:complete
MQIDKERVLLMLGVLLTLSPCAFLLGFMASIMSWDMFESLAGFVVASIIFAAGLLILSRAEEKKRQRQIEDYIKQYLG